MTDYTCTIALAAAFYAVPVLADEPISITQQIAKPTQAARVSYDHWSFIRSKQQSHVCVTTNIDSKPYQGCRFKTNPSRVGPHKRLQLRYRPENGIQARPIRFF